MHEKTNTATKNTLENHSEEPSSQKLEKPALSEAERKVRRARIQTLNDLFRTTFVGGRVVSTQGIHALSPELKCEIANRVQTFSDFSEDNDPHEEHDYGSFSIEGNRVAWKIDYYDKDVVYGSENPADPEVTTRVLTIMLSSEY